MMAEDIMAANPDIEWRHETINKGKQKTVGLIGRRKSGEEFFVTWSGNYHAACSLPLNQQSIGWLRKNLRAAVERERKNGFATGEAANETSSGSLCEASGGGAGPSGDGSGG
jgi:hypothetical protein